MFSTRQNSTFNYCGKWFLIANKFLDSGITDSLEESCGNTVNYLNMYRAVSSAITIQKRQGDLEGDLEMSILCLYYNL